MVVNRLRLTSLLGIVLMTGILAMINYLAIQHGGRWDLSETQHFSLAPQTLRVIGALRQPVKITVFSHERSPGFRTYRDLLESYGHGNPLIHVAFVDPEHQPGLAKQYHITRLDTAVFESGPRTIQISKPTEVALTNALIRVTKEAPKKITFLAGHGERNIESHERDGYAVVQETLRAQGYDVSQSSLTENPQLLNDTDVLVIAGPRSAIDADTQHHLSQYLHSTGRVLILLDPLTNTGLESFLNTWGLKLGPGIVVDEQDRLAQGAPTALLVRTFTDHDITHNLEEPVMFPVARHIVFDTHNAMGWDFMALAHTSKNSWVETNLTNTTPVLDPEEDTPGPLILAGVLEGPTRSNASALSPAMIVVGNSAFGSNIHIKFPGNTDFLLQSIAWLAGEQHLVSVAPKDPAVRPFTPNPTQEHMLLAIQVFSVPVLILLLGLTIWHRRRQL